MPSSSRARVEGVCLYSADSESVEPDNSGGKNYNDFKRIIFLFPPACSYRDVS